MCDCRMTCWVPFSRGRFRNPLFRENDSHRPRKWSPNGARGHPKIDPNDKKSLFHGLHSLCSRLLVFQDPYPCFSRPEAPKNDSKNQLEKTPPQKLRKNPKSAENELPKGGPRVALERCFRTFSGSWVPMGAIMAPRPRPGAPRTRPNLDFW